MSREFKVGDRVRFETNFYSSPCRRVGTGVVAGFGGHPSRRVLVRLDGKPGSRWPYGTGELTLIEPEPKFKKGDRVRVTIEGEVQRAFDSGALWLPGGLGSTVDPDHIVSAEKIEPPVEPFKPGDFVREISSGQVFYVAKGGYVQVKPWPASFVEFHNGDIENDLPSTTGEYERVEYAEVPF